MIDLFKRSAGDLSYEYLGGIFGSMNGVLPGGQTNILGTMFQTFNSVVLAIAALMLVYVTVVGVMKTAHEGEFMGKQWNNIWIPIRSVLGIAMLVPTASGYCVLQIIMMWIIVQGIGAADVLWGTALGYLEVFGSPYAQVKHLPDVGTQEALSGLFQSLVCDANARVKGNPPNVPSEKSAGYFCASGGGDAICSQPLTFNQNSTTFTMGPKGNCGAIMYCDQNAACAGNLSASMGCLSCKAQVSALAAIIPTLAGIASQVAAADAAYQDFYANSGKPNANKSNYAWVNGYCTDNQTTGDCCVSSGSTDLTKIQCRTDLPLPYSEAGEGGLSNTSKAAMLLYWKYWPGLGPSLGDKARFIATAQNYYMDQATAAYAAFVQAQRDQTQGLSGLLGEAQNQGWIVAGGYYSRVANRNTSNLTNAIPKLDWKPMETGGGDLKGYRINFSTAKILINAGNASGTSGGTSGAEGSSDAAKGTVDTVSSSFQDSLTQSGTNPLMAMQIVGSVMLIAVELLYALIFILMLISSLLEGLSVFALGTGIITPTSTSSIVMAMYVFPAIFALMGYMITLGGLMAVYVPLIPYVIFTFGAIGWFISVVEAMVAGPLVALGVISPSGQHELLGKAEPALGLLFNLFLRPSLMIFGLVAAMLLAVAVVKMINALFWTVVVQGLITSGSFSLILFPLMLLGVYVMTIIAALNKCFEVINYLPAKVTSWVSIQGGEMVQAPLSDIKGGMESVGGGATAGIKGGQAAGREAGQAKEAQQEREFSGQASAQKDKKDDKKYGPKQGPEKPP